MTTTTPSISTWDTHRDEQRYIGGLYEFLFSKRNFEETTRLLTGIDETWFKDDDHRALFLAAFQLATQALDPKMRVTVTGCLDQAEEIRGETGWSRDTFAKCSEACGVFSVDEFLLEEAPLWWEKLKKPKVQELMAKADQLCSLPPRRDTTPAVRDYLSSAIDALNEEPTCNAPEVDPLMDSYRRFMQPLPEESVIPTGLRVMDGLLQGGLSGPGAPSGGKLIVVCARPGMGKTQVVLNLGMRVALAGYKVVLWSMEMQAAQIHARLFCALDFFNAMNSSGGHGPAMTYSMVSRGMLSAHPEVMARYREMEPQAQALGDSFKVLKGTHTADAICNTMRLFARANPDTRLFIVDHLGLLDTGNNMNKAIAVGEATRKMKTTATELGIDVLLCSQLNRGLEQRTDKMPTLADLRDSGRIEEDADVVFGLLRPNAYDPEHDPHDLQIGNLKNRQAGRTGNFPARINNDCCAVFEQESLLG